MRLLIILLFFVQILLADSLVVSSTPIGSDEDNRSIMNPINSSFPPNLQIGNIEILEIPIYVKSNVLDEIKMKISNFSNLTKVTESIDTRLYYRSITNSYVQIFDNQEFVLLTQNQIGRDGNTIIGYLKVEANILNNQTYGNYSFNDTIHVKLANSTWVNNNFHVNANVALVAIAGFNSTSSYSSGQQFVSDHINFGNFNFSSNNIEKNLYIKSNSSNNFRITFNNTPNLIHELDNNYQINMHYYYKQTGNTYFEIQAGTSFIAIVGKNEGLNPIGIMKFETESISGSKLAGDYSTSVLVTVSAD